MSKAWCSCGDELRNCEEVNEGRFQFNEQLGYTDLDRNNTYYCFGCDKFFILKELDSSYTGNQNEGGKQ